MNKTLLSIFLFFALITSLYSQVSYKNGYYINNSDQKIECLIYDMDWKNSPSKFDFKTAENSETLTEKIENIKEFGIYDGSKYIRATVEIDRSTDQISKMERQRNPVFKNETIFLKSIIEGAASLYYYRDGVLGRYFFKNAEGPITQLVYKRYVTESGAVAKNSFFKQQLFSDLTCESIVQKDLESLQYELKDLERFFYKYNECQNSTSISYNPKQKKDLFNLAIRPGVDFNSLNVYLPEANRRNVDFGKQTNFRIGLEAEYIIPYYNNKWSIIVEPTYQTFSGEKTYTTTGVVGQTLTAEVKYSSIELPLGIRHSLFLNESSKIFLNAQYLVNFDLSPSLDYYRGDGSEFDHLDIKSAMNFAFGAGFKFQDRYIIEFRYQTARYILASYQNWNADYKTMSVIIGYNFL